MLEKQKKLIKPDIIVEEKAPSFWSKVFGVWSVSPVIQVAAGFAILIGGIIIGLNVRSINNSGTGLADMQKEFIEMKEMLMYSLIENESPSQRIKAVNYTEEFEIPDEKLINVLINTLKNDEILNVRMAAAYALANNSDNKKVKAAFIYALENEEDPGMQIIIINLLAQAGAKNALEPLNRILRNNETPLLVKDRAVRAIQTLL